MGRMPVLELNDGSFLSESVAICRYVEEELQPEPNLFGSGPRERAEIEMWNRRVEFGLMSPIMTGFEHLSPFWKGKRAQHGPVGEHARQVALERMAWLDDELSDREFIAGSRYTVADITAQCALVLGKNAGVIQQPDAMVQGSLIQTHSQGLSGDSNQNNFLPGPMPTMTRRHHLASDGTISSKF